MVYTRIDSNRRGCGELLRESDRVRGRANADPQLAEGRLKVSDDRKAWFVSVSDAVDPHELMGRKPSGDFMIWFFVDPGNGSLRPSGPMKTCKRCQAICKT